MRFLTGKAVFIRISLGIALLRYVVGLKTSRHFVVQLGIKPNPMVTGRRPHSSVSCSSCQLLVFLLSFHWFSGLSTFFMTGSVATGQVTVQEK